MLEQALWQRFGEAEDVESFAGPWLALQCRFLEIATRGVVVLGSPGAAPYVPIAFWPEETADVAGLSAAAEAAITERRGILQSSDEEPVGDDGSHFLAYPFLIEDVVLGVVAVETSGTQKQLRQAMRQLQWGSGWITAMIRRGQLDEGLAQRERSGVVIDLAALVLDERGFRAACVTAVTDLARRFDCEQVSVGFKRRGRTSVVSLSHAAQLGRRMNLIRDLGSAMDEAIDQEAMVVYPPLLDQEFRIDRAHGELARRHETGNLLTVPFSASDEIVGALIFERPSDSAFDHAAIETCDSLAAILGPILNEKRFNDRWIVRKILASFWTQVVRIVGPRYAGRKVAVVVLACVVAFLATAQGPFRVKSPAVIEGSVLRVLSAPYDGFIATQYIRAGDVVREGQVMASFDDKDIAIEKLRWETRRQQHLTEYDKAIGDGDRAQSRIIQAQVKQAEAQVALLEAQLARTEIRAPFDGVVTTGDLSQSVGASAQQGDPLFEVVPLNSYRVILEIDERDLSDIETGQMGNLLLTSLPNQSYEFVVGKVVPATEAKDGRNFFRVEASLVGGGPELRPGMHGVAKVEVENRLLIKNWSKKLVDWFRILIWKWTF